jgi:uncharacterized protein (TIGR02597 family)
MKLKIAIPSLAAALLAALPTANAQNATTDPVGFTTLNVRAKTTAARAFTMAVISMERTDAFNGSLAGASFSLDAGRTVITFPSDLFTANQFTGSGNQHYLSIKNGSNAGDFSTIASNTANSITLSDDLNSVLSTSTTFSVTPYWTLGTAFPSGGGLQGGTSVTAADNVIIYNSNFVGTTYFYNSTLARWRTGLTDSNNVIIPPGTGIAIERKQNTPVAIIIPGSVPLGASTVDVNGSASGSATRFTLVGSAYPLASRSISEIGLYTGDSTTGLAGGSSVTAADNVIIFDPATGNPTTYFYNTTASQWRTGLTPSNSVTIPEGAAVRIVRKNGRAPFTWYIPQPTMALNN